QKAHCPAGGFGLAFGQRDVFGLPDGALDGFITRCADGLLIGKAPFIQMPVSLEIQKIPSTLPQGVLSPLQPAWVLLIMQTAKTADAIPFFVVIHLFQYTFSAASRPKAGRTAQQ